MLDNNILPLNRINVSINKLQLSIPTNICLNYIIEKINYSPNSICLLLNNKEIAQNLWSTTLINANDSIQIKEILLKSNLFSDDTYKINNKSYTSRNLSIINDSHNDFFELHKLLLLSGSEILFTPINLLNKLTTEFNKYTLIPYCSQPISLEQTIKTFQKIRDDKGLNIIKLKVLDPKNTNIDNISVDQTLEAAKKLIDLGFSVIAYANHDIELIKELDKLGCAAVIIALNANYQDSFTVIQSLKTKKLDLKTNIILDLDPITATLATSSLEAGYDAICTNLSNNNNFTNNSNIFAASIRYAVISGRHAYQSQLDNKINIPSSVLKSHLEFTNLKN